MKPVISANIFSGQAALRASSTWPSTSTMAASTGVGLLQCVHPQAGQRKRALSAPVFLLGDPRKGRGTVGQ